MSDKCFRIGSLASQTLTSHRQQLSNQPLQQLKISGQTEGTQKRPIQAMNDVTIKHSVVSLFCTDPYIHVYCIYTNIHVLLKCKCKR